MESLVAGDHEVGVVGEIGVEVIGGSIDGERL